MEDIPNWKRLGLKNKDEAIKVMLASLLKNKKKIIDLGLGGAWDQGKNKHGEIPEYREAAFYFGDSAFYLTDRGFIGKSDLR